MGKATGFLETARMEAPLRPALERMRDFSELHEGVPEEVRHLQASRCMNCGVPFCQSDYGCPLHNLIPEWNDLLWRGQERMALQRLLMTAPFPEFTGRVCPALCEKACNLGQEGVTNRDNELYLIEEGYARGWIQPRIPENRTGKRVLVVGSGPSGLACADRLNQMGHSVTVLDRADRPGGLLMYGIPNMKLPKETVTRRVRLLEEEGISFLLNMEATPEIASEYDAVVLCGGARRARMLQVPGEEAAGILPAVTYLTESTRAFLEGREPLMTAKGKHVIVVGGGDTGNDCVGTALWQGCLQVTQLEMMPPPPAERLAQNPWPEWPRILRTDYGQLEAIARQGTDPRIYETTVKRICTDEEGNVSAVETVGLRWEGRSGIPIEGSETEFPCQLLLIAAGFVGCEKGTAEVFGVQMDARGRMMPEDGSHYLGGNLFSAGDMRGGQSLVVRALADGRTAAIEVDAFLQQKRK